MQNASTNKKNQLRTRLDNLFYFLNDYEVHRKYSVIYCQALILLYFLQLFGQVCSSDIRQPTDNLSKALFVLGRYARLVPFPAELRYQYTQTILLSLLLCLDLLCLYSVARVSQRNTNQQYDNEKKVKLQIGFIHAYLNVYRAVVATPKLITVFSSLICSYNYEQQGPICDETSFYPVRGIRGLTAALSVLNLVTFVPLFLLQLFALSTGEFFCANLLKTRYSLRKIFECCMHVLVVAISYVPDLQIFWFIVVHVHSFYCLAEYFALFPLYPKQLSFAYLFYLTMYVFSTVLLTLQHIFQFDANIFFITVSVIGVMVYGLLRNCYAKLWSLRYLNTSDQSCAVAVQ